jgi:hypothetical protein
MGRAYLIRKRTAHVGITIAEKKASIKAVESKK